MTCLISMLKCNSGYHELERTGAGETKGIERKREFGKTLVMQFKLYLPLHST